MSQKTQQKLLKETILLESFNLNDAKLLAFHYEDKLSVFSIGCNTSVGHVLGTHIIYHEIEVTAC